MKSLVVKILILFGTSPNGFASAGTDELDEEFKNNNFYGNSQLSTEQGYTCADKEASDCKFSPELTIKNGEERKRGNRKAFKFRDNGGNLINQAEKKVLKDLRHDLGHMGNYLKNSKLNPNCEGTTMQGFSRGRRHALHHEDYNHDVKECYPKPSIQDVFFMAAVVNDLDYMKIFFDNDLIKKTAAKAQGLVDYMLQDDELFDEASQFNDNDAQNNGNNRRKKRHDDNLELTEQQKELEATYRNTIEKLKDAISCRLDFLWAHFLGIEDFTGKDCTFCHNKDEREGGSVKKCPIRDNENIDQKYKARPLDIDAALLCEQPGRCSDMRHLFNL